MLLISISVILVFNGWVGHGPHILVKSYGLYFARQSLLVLFPKLLEGVVNDFTKYRAHVLCRDVHEANHADQVLRRVVQFEGEPFADVIFIQ